MSVTQRPLKTGLPVSTQAPVNQAPGQTRTGPTVQTPVGQTQHKQPVRTTDGAATVSETKALDVQAIPHAQQAGAVVLQAFTKTLRIPEREIKTRLGNLLGPVAATLGKPVNTPEALAAAQKTLQTRFGPMGGLMYLQDAKELVKRATGDCQGGHRAQGVPRAAFRLQDAAAVAGTCGQVRRPAPAGHLPE